MPSDFDRIVSERELLDGQLQDFLKDVEVSGDITPPTSRHIDLIKAFYFALNRAYKPWRIEDGHRTQPSKIAALVALSVMAVSPFRSAKQSDNFFRINPLFALHAGLTRVEVTVSDIGVDSVKRLIRWLNIFHLSGASDWINRMSVLVETAEFASYEEIPLSLSYADVANIDMMVAYVEALLSARA